MDTVKLIIKIPKPMYEDIKSGKDGYSNYAHTAIRNGTPLDSNSEKAEVRAYFDGESFGWDEGREALIEELKAEIDKLPLVLLAGNYHIDKDYVMEILNRIGKADSKGEWIEESDNYGHSSYFCSRCGTQEGKPSDICPNCRARMKGGE